MNETTETTEAVEVAHEIPWTEMIAAFAAGFIAAGVTYGLTRKVVTNNETTEEADES